MSLLHSLRQSWSRKSQEKKSAKRKQTRKLNGMRGLLFEGLEERSMLTITQIALSNFTAPRVLDFQSVPTGPIASNAAVFQAIGISSVTGTSDADVDSYSTGSPAASRALAATSTGLRVIDPNSGNASDRFGNNNAYTINFAQPQTKFGFTNDDSGGSNPTPFPFNIVLFSGATQVDSGVVLAPVFGQNPLYFSSTVAFDRVVISNSLGDGFVIDNLTTETPGPQVTISPALTSINENDVASATITITNPDPTDVHSANINWGEGTPDTITGLGLTDTSGTVGATGYTWTAATRTLVVTHRYLDDNPTSTTSNIYAITAKVADDDMSGNFAGTVGLDYVQSATAITVNNVRPTFSPLPSVSNPVLENGTCSIIGTVSDPGTQDTFRFQVSWGDGTVDVITLGAVSTSGTIGGTNYNWDAGIRAYTFSHRYLDDTPTDTVDIALRVADDDMTGNFAGTNGVDFTLVGGTISLLNVAPSLGPISVLTSPITEGGTANASVTITDPGTLDVFAANINWGQGTPDTIAGLGLSNSSGIVGATSYVWIAATRVLNLTHQYPNDTVFTGNTNYTITVKVADDDMTGNFAGAAGGTNYVESTTTITVIDDEGLPPQITASGFFFVTEDQASPLTGISFTAAGTGFVAVTTTFSVLSGTLTATSGGGVTVNGSGTRTLTLNGTPANINAFISSSNLKFQTVLNQTSPVALTIGINDNGSGGAPAQTASRIIALNVNPVNDNPVNTVPTLATNEDTPVNVTGFSISDVDSTGPFSVNVRFNNVAAGILTFRTDVPGGLTDLNILNNGTSNTTILGASLGAINTTLSATNGLVYTPAANFNGLALFAVDTNSDGNGGSDVGDTEIWTVSAVNDAPTITAPATYSTQQGIATSLTGISFADVDVGMGPVSVQLGVASGTLTAAASGSVTIGGSGTGLVSLSGSIADINTYISGSNLSYTNSTRGAVALVITINDNGRTGSGGAQTTMTTSTINVAETPSLVVTTNNDGSTPIDGLTSLREAIAYANIKPGADTITFGDGTATGGTNFLDSTADTITIGTIGDGNAGPSAFGITSDITIQGNATTGITLQGGGSSSNTRAFYVASTGSLSLQNLTITDFRHQGGGSNRGGGAAGMGGAIFVNGGTLNLLATTFANNAAEGGALGSFSDGGGGLGGDAFGQYGGGGPNAFGSDARNGASGGFGGGGNAYGGNGGFGGGGAYSGTGGFGGGGGVFTAGGFGAGNGGIFGPGGGAGMGGAIFSNGGTINISNSTFNQNAAIGGAFITFNSGQGLGGVLFARNGSVTINNSTLSGNTAADGGRGVYILSDASNGGNNSSPGSGSATVVINNTIIGQSDNSVSDFVANTNAGGATPVTSGVGNLIRNAVGFSGTIVSTADPQLAALANNGGPTLTMALPVASPARDTGSNSATPGGVTTDQRGTGFTRIFGGTVDIGAFEFIATAPMVTAPTATNVALTTATLGGNVTDDGGATITERGIVWSVTALNNNPQIGGASVTQLMTAGTTGVFTIDVTALPTGSQISYAAYATNIAGTSYTTVGTFTTQPAIGQFPGITVQILGGQMIVTGTPDDDTIKVASDGMGGYIVTANKNINGLPSPQSFSGATSFVANTLGGHDDLWLAAPLTLDDVTVDLGNGNDRLVLGADPNNAINNNVLDPQFGTLGYLTVNGPVNVIGGEGNDRVIERSTNINGVKTINLGEGNNEYNVYWGFSNETIFSSGAGTDNVYIGYLSSREASQFDTGAGNDLISYYASRFYKTAYLNSGAGADTVALDVNIYDEATTVDTGSEADYLLFSRSVAYKSVVLTTAAGADTVLIGKYISGLGSNGSPIYSNGGSNIDDLTLNTGVEADTVQVAANVMRLFFANLGDAYDDAEVEFNLFTDGFLDGGGQDMRLRLRSNSGLRTRNPG